MCWLLVLGAIRQHKVWRVVLALLYLANSGELSAAAKVLLSVANSDSLELKSGYNGGGSCQ
jgi:hypothetical protein